MKKLGMYGAGLIALYLIVANGSKFGTAVSAGSAGGVNIIKAFQGR
jgi:hypothetical protein